MSKIDALVRRHADKPDLHITRIMGCFVVVSEGEVVEVDRSEALTHCPLQAMLSEAEVEDYLREKVREFGHFTARREICRCHHGVPFGASEMMMYALEKGTYDCAVTVCDGVGSIATDRPDVVQGVGARMNGIFHTSPIPEVMERYRAEGAILFDDAKIDQIRMLEAALREGYQRIMVTVNGYHGESFRAIRDLEKSAGTHIVAAAVCTTGIPAERADEIVAHADIAWSCASGALRERGSRARIQITRGIPIFVYTDKGVDFLSCYSDAEGAEELRKLNPDLQWLLAAGRGGRMIRMGEKELLLVQTELPADSQNAPKPLR